MTFGKTFGIKFGPASVAVSIALSMAASAFAAPPPKAKPISLDRSFSFLIDAATEEKLWRDNTSARVLKLYPMRKFRFVSEVGGGFNEGKLCVVSARAMLLPMKGKLVVYTPLKAATAFDAVPSLSREQCQELARAKLVEAIQSVDASLAAS